MQGGKKKTPFKTGETVYYKKEKNFHTNKRLWKIKNIGRLFLTIETDDTRGMKSIKDCIQVVPPMDVQRVDDIPEINSSFPITEPNMMPFNNMAHNIQPNPSTIQINPSFKIINGPDNSTGVEPTKTIDMVPMGSSYQNSSFVVPNQPNIIFPQTNGLDVIQQPSIATDEDIFTGSSKNIIIKKLG